MLGLSYHRRALFFLLNSNLLQLLKKHLCDPRHHGSERLEDPEWKKWWLIIYKIEIVSIFKKSSLQRSYFLIRIVPHHFHLLLESLMFREVDSKTEEMLWCSFFEGMQAKSSNENALYIDYLNKMSVVVAKVMFLSKNVLHYFCWLVIIEKLFSNWPNGMFYRIYIYLVVSKGVFLNKSHRKLSIFFCVA